MAGLHRGLGGLPGRRKTAPPSLRRKLTTDPTGPLGAGTNCNGGSSRTGGEGTGGRARQHEAEERGDEADGPVGGPAAGGTRRVGQLGIQMSEKL